MLFSINVFAQYEDFGCEIEGNAKIGWPTDGTILNYIPDEYTSTKYVKVNFHFMMKSDSTLNFRPCDDGLGNTSFTAYDYINEIVRYANLRLLTNSPMHLPQGNTTPCLERRYIIVTKGIYFHYDDNAYSNKQNTSGYMDVSELSHYCINQTSEINIFLLYYDEDEYGEYSSGGSANTYGNRYVRIHGSWQKYRDYNDIVFWGASANLIHEIGHNLGLLHTMLTNYGICCDSCDDFLSDTPTIPEITEMGYPYPCGYWGSEGE